MKGYKPDGADHNFVSGGFKCAVGINNDTEGQWDIYMTKQKQAGGATEAYQDWELVFVWAEANKRLANDFKGDFVAMFNAFGKAAAPNLKKMTGGTVPEMPTDIIEKLYWHVRYKLAFRADTFEVYHQG